MNRMLRIYTKYLTVGSVPTQEFYIILRDKKGLCGSYKNWNKITTAQNINMEIVLFCRRYYCFLEYYFLFEQCKRSMNAKGEKLNQWMERVRR